MQQPIFGIDIGTTSICGVAVSASGNLIASVERPNDSMVTGLPAGRVEQDPERIRERVVEVLCALVGRVGQVGGIGITGQMHGMLAVDANNQPLTNLVIWQDGRGLERSPSGETWLECMRRHVPAEAWASCGCEPASGFLGTTLFWMSRNKALPAKTARVCFIHDWIAGWLTGQVPSTDPSDAASSGVFDLAHMRWHGEIIRELQLPDHVLPAVRESGEVIGGLSPERAEAIGIAAGTPVCNAIGDNQASVIGSMADMQNSLLLNLGTGGQISWAVDEFVRAPGMETRYLPWGAGRLPNAFAGRFMLVGASLCGGRAYAWLNDVVRDWLGEFGCKVDREQAYERLNELATLAPADRGGLSARTTFAGTRSEPGLRGAVGGISLDNFSLGNMARSILAGMVEELCVMYDQAGGKSVYHHSKVVASGNAVRKNPLLPGMIGSRTGCPVLIPRHREEAAFGAALLAGASNGFWPDLDAAGRTIQYQ